MMDKSSWINTPAQPSSRATLRNVPCCCSEGPSGIEPSCTWSLAHQCTWIGFLLSPSHFPSLPPVFPGHFPKKLLKLKSLFQDDLQNLTQNHVQWWRDSKNNGKGILVAVGKNLRLRNMKVTGLIHYLATNLCFALLFGTECLCPSELHMLRF